MDSQAVPTTAKKKKQRLTGILRAVFYTLRKKSRAKGGDVGLWKKLLGSMRTLHLHQSNQSPPQTAMSQPQIATVQHVQMFTPPLSPALLTSVSSSVDGGSSKYASALNLQELDRCNEEDEYEDDDDEDEVWEDGAGDEMIDAKAEEFISQFYEQMRVQLLERANRTNWSLR